jgi:hypothetical protein
VSGSGVETHLRDELVNKDHNTDSADEAAQEWSTKYGIQETKSAQSSSENDGTCESCDHACYLSILAACLIPVVA